jgi:hypothetical protein
MVSCPLNQNIDNLNKHGELFLFSELLVKFPRTLDDILLTLVSDTKMKRIDQVGGGGGQGDTELGKKWWQFRREKEKFKGMKIWIASQETLYEVRQRKKA